MQSTLQKIHPIAGSVINAQFADATTNGSCITVQPINQPPNSYVDAMRGPPVSNGCSPSDKFLRLTDFSTGLIVFHRIHTVKTGGNPEGDACGPWMQRGYLPKTAGFSCLPIPIRLQHLHLSSPRPIRI